MKQSAISEPDHATRVSNERSDLSIIDRSVRIPVLIFLASGVFWLIVASGFWLLSLFANPYTDGMVDISGCCLVEFRPCLSCFSQLLCLRMGYMRGYRCRHLAAGAFQSMCRCAIHCFRSSRLPPGMSGSLWSPIDFGWGDDR